LFFSQFAEERQTFSLAGVGGSQIALRAIWLTPIGQRQGQLQA
jgi:hypothetical protein